MATELAPIPRVDPPSVAPKHPAALCSACPLYDREYVPTLFAPKGMSRLAVVGEAPGENEVINQRPFIGKSGYLLSKSLGQLVDMDGDVTLLNAVSCFPGRGIKPNRKAIRCCRPRLMAELGVANPTMILTTGGVPLQALKDDYSLGIMAERGKPFAVAELGGVEAYPTIHPAFVLREGAHWKDFKADLERAVERLERIEGGVPDVPFRMPRVTIPTTTRSARETLRWLRETQSALSVDIETGSVLNRIRFKSDPILCVAVSYGEGDEGIVFSTKMCADLEVRKELVFLLNDDSITHVYQNGKFDQKFLNAQWGADAHVGWDTMLASYALDERKGIHSLEYLVDHVLHAPNYKDETEDWIRGELRRRRLVNMRLRREAKRDGRAINPDDLLADPTFADLPREMLHERAGLDAAFTLRIARIQVDSIRAEGLWPYAQLLFQAGNVYAKMETRGLPMDHTYRAQLSRDMTVEIARMEQEIREMVPDFAPFNPNSPAQVSALLFEHLGLPVPRIAWGRNKHNAEVVQKVPSCAKPVLEELSGTHVVVDAIRDLRAIKKLKSSYVDNTDICDCGRLHPDFKLHGTVTGRRSEPVMTIPKPKPGKPNMRALVTAPAGRVLMEFDYKAGELRVAAALSGDPIMRDALLKGEDLHDRLMVELEMGTKESCIAEMHGDVKEGLKLYESRRRDAKIVNFGVLYGMEKNLLAQTIKKPTEVAEDFLRRYWARYEGVKAWIEGVRDGALKTGRLASPFGCVRRYGLVTGDVEKSIRKEAGNYFPQEILSHCTLMSLLMLQDWIEWQGWDVHPILEMHDSLLLEMPDDAGMMRDVADDLTAFMALVPGRVLGTDLPFDVDVKAGRRWGVLDAYAGRGGGPTVPEGWWDVAARAGAWLPASLRSRDHLRPPRAPVELAYA